ncbi:MAG: PmoA family protein [Cyclobacteriaceae bacterium]
MKTSTILSLFIILIYCFSCKQQTNEDVQSGFYTEQNDSTILVFQKGISIPVLTQKVGADFRPYIHPLLAPNSEAQLTQYSPGHHKHQTGLYWGFTRVNGGDLPKDTIKKWFYKKEVPESIRKNLGRDYFHNPENGYWKKVSAEVLKGKGERLRWRTVYNMLDEEGKVIMEETQIWEFSQEDGRNVLNLEWQGKAIEDIKVNKFDYGGLFLRMPWNKEIDAEVVNAARQKNSRGDRQRAMWADVGMQIEGLDDWGHIAIFDHPDNEGFPQTWRVDGQFGIGPSRCIMGDWHIKKGDTKTYKHQLLAYTGKIGDVEMDELWAKYTGDDGMYNKASLWGIAQQEGLTAKFLTPEEAIESMTIKEGYQVNTFASEPMITQPMAFCWDDKGRMWIAENRDYESRQTGFSGSGDSRILILEDTDRDGVADSKKVFLEDIPFPSAIAVGFGGLYLGAPPNLLFIPDKDQNDKGDVEDIEILLTGWGIRDRHETINSLHWGPDGWLYGLEGFATPSKIRKPKGKGKILGHKDPFPEDILEAEGVDINGGVWRYHPTKDIFEVVAHGLSNPWGVDYDAKGQMFISACVIPHMFHIIPGGIYHRQGGRHFNPYVYKDIQTIVDHRHRSAHGGARIYQSDAFPADQQGRVFMANIHEHAVLSDVLSKNGSGFSASHGEDFMLANNGQWIGFSMEVGPEGGLYVLDWHDADICGKDVKNKETGRVFRMMPEETLAENWPGRYDNLQLLNDSELVQLQLSKSDWHSRRARVILQGRATKGNIENSAVEDLFDILQKNENNNYRLRALWSLHVTKSISEEKLKALLKDKDEYIRSWAIQFLAEDKHVSQEILKEFENLANRDESSAVRLYLAAALQRISFDDRWELAGRLAQKAEDINDPNIPLMLWFGIEPLVEDNPQKALEMASAGKIPMISNHIARRLADADQLGLLVDAINNQDVNAINLLTGLLAAIEGRQDIKEPTNWPDTYQQLKSNDKLSEVAQLISQQFGSAAAAEQMLSTVLDDGADLSKRQKAIGVLSSQKNLQLQNELENLLSEDGLSISVIRAIAHYNVRGPGELLLAKYPNFNDQEQREAIQTLASRTVYGRLLANAIKTGEIAKKDIPAYTAQQLRRVVGNGFVEIWGPIDDISSNKESDYKKYRRLLSDEALAGANLVKGKGLYLSTCGPCHKMFGEGGDIGPDLTGSNRGNTAYLLGNVIEPSSELQDDYRLVVITTQDGQTFSGNIVEEDERRLTLKVVGMDLAQISKSDIRSKEVSNKSMMPEGLFNNLEDDEVIDLVGYLKTLEQVESN